MTDTAALDSRLAALLQSVSVPGRRKIAKNVAVTLRRSQQKRIADQRNPDGSQYESRKPIRARHSGRIRQGAMFSRIRTAKFLRASSNATEASVEFASRVTRLANVHQFGLRDRLSKTGPQVRYARRELLGFSDADLESINAVVFDELAAQL